MHRPSTRAPRATEKDRHTTQFYDSERCDTTILQHIMGGFLRHEWLLRQWRGNDRL